MTGMEGGLANDLVQNAKVGGNVPQNYWVGSRGWADGI